MKTFNKDAVIRGAIRRSFARAPVKQEVLKAVRKEFPRYNKDGSRSKKDSVCYLCNVCKEYKGSTIVSVDHIESVISVQDGFIDWNTFIERVYCDKENLQVICHTCHQIKTNKERLERNIAKDERRSTMFIHTKKEELTLEELKWIKSLTPKKLSKYPKELADKLETFKKRFK